MLKSTTYDRIIQLDIMQKSFASVFLFIFLTISFFVFIFGAQSILAQDNQPEIDEEINIIQPETKTNVVYFYTETCPHCQAIKPLLKEIEQNNKDIIRFKRYEVRAAQAWRDLFNEFLNAYNVPQGQGGVPAIFIGDTALIGEDEIRDRLQNIINYCADHSCPLKNGLDDDVGGFKKRPSSSRGGLSLPLVLSAGFIDSINPCAIGVLLILISFLLTVKTSRKRLLTLGGVYIFAVFLTYFLAGLGLLKLIGHFEITHIVKGLAGGILLIAGVLSFKEVFKPGTTFLRIPERAKGFLTKWLTKASLPGTFLAGAIVSGVELPCTGEVYLGILSMLSGAADKAAGLAYLVLYNFIFVLPLILILLLAVFGFRAEKIQELFKSRTRLMRISAGILMLALGGWLLAGIL